MSRRRLPLSVALVCVATVSATTLGACATDDAAAKDDTLADLGPLGAERLADPGFDASGYNRRDLDLNRDGKPDAYQFATIDAEGNLQVRRKEVDVNFDGKIDLIRMLDEKGELIEERLDADFDGHIDLVVSFQKGVIVKKSYDTNFDETADMWRYFEGGQIAREEADLNYDGKVDLWEYYEGGQLDRTGVDRDGDGQVDEWQSRESGG